MSDELSLRAAQADAPDRIALCVGDRRLTFSELADACASIELGPGPVTPSAGPDLESLLSAYAAIDRQVLLAPMAADLAATTRDELRRRVESEVLPSSELAVLFTSGTSGLPKGVVLSRAAFIASARASQSTLACNSDDRWLCPLSWARVGGLSILTRSLIARSCAIVTGPDNLARAIERHRPTLLSIVPVQLEALLADSSWRAPPQLRAVLVGGGPLGADQLQRSHARGLVVVPTYGMTETCSQVATAPPGQSIPAGAVGRVLPGIEVAIDDQGCIEIDGPTLMTGYLGEPLHRGPLSTGDHGRLEDGWLYVRGRADDRIDTGGLRVDPTVIEQHLLEVDGIADACVFGLPDPTWGQVVAALVVIEAPMAVADAAGAIQAIARAWPSSERPRRLRLTDEIPRSNAGKRSRALLAETVHGDWLTLRYRTEM